MSADVDPLGPARTGWEEARAALAEAAAGACTVLRSIERPNGAACGRWNVAETAAHLSHAWQALPCLAARDLDTLRATLPAVPGMSWGLPSGALLRPQDSLDAMTTGLVTADPERDLNRLADRIEASAKDFCERFDPTRDPGPRPWMIEGLTGGPELFACHLLSETLVHTYDLARAAGSKWSVPERGAALAFRGFLLPVIVGFSSARAAAGDVRPPFGLELRLAGDCRLLISSTSAGVRVQAPGTAPTDAVRWIRPSAMLLLAWQRRSLRSVVLARQSVVWGRRPWMARKVLTLAPGR